MAGLGAGAAQKWRPWLYDLALLCFLGGMLFSKFLLSLSSILPLLAALVLVDFRGHWAALRGSRLAQGGLAIVLWVALSGLYSADKAEWWTRLRVLLPLGFLPWAWASLGGPDARAYRRLLHWFLGAYALAACGVLINYALDYEAITESMKHSKPIPCPEEDHIRFSLALCLGAFASAWAWFRFRPRWMYGLLAVFFVGVLHVLSVRSGLLALYLGIFWALVLWIWRSRRWLLGGSLVLVLLSAPVGAYWLLDSFRAKVHLTLYNLELYRQGRVEDYSDTQRLLSYSIAWELSQREPWLGLGMGDLWPEQQAVYEARYPSQRKMFPHNQFLSFLAGTGILGLLIFIGGIFWPWLGERRWQEAYFGACFLALCSSFMTENTLFVSMGVHLYVYGLLLAGWALEAEQA